MYAINCSHVFLSIFWPCVFCMKPTCYPYPLPPTHGHWSVTTQAALKIPWGHPAVSWLRAASLSRSGPDKTWIRWIDDDWCSFTGLIRPHKTWSCCQLLHVFHWNSRKHHESSSFSLCSFFSGPFYSSHSLVALKKDSKGEGFLVHWICQVGLWT